MGEKKFIDCLPIEKDLEERYNYYRKESEVDVGNGILINETLQTEAIVTKYFLDKIKQAPAADVVEVVRCKDCKHFKEGDPVFLRTPDICGHFSGYDDVEVKPDDFCSYGERKEQT